jgi:hypothetical protein
MGCEAIGKPHHPLGWTGRSNCILLFSLVYMNLPTADPFSGEYQIKAYLNHGQ